MTRFLNWLFGLFAGPKNPDPTQPPEPPKTKAGPPPTKPR